MLLPLGTTQVAEKPPSVALVNFSRKSFKIIADHAVLLKFDEEKREAYIGKWDTADDWWDGKSGFDKYRIGPDGKIELVERMAPGQRVPSLPPPPESQWISLRAKDGYLRPEREGEAAFEARMKDDTPVYAIWVRPGIPAVILPIRWEEIHETIHGSAEYVAFLDKYLLNTHDTQGHSSTDAHLRRVWRRPYEYTPFRLLSPSGQVEEIPYPRFIFEYGIADPPTRDQTNRNFKDFALTKAGIVITKWREVGS